jgi:peptidoglycan/xylan/chitin deacetylase (PgdA/CDA1 family)
MNASSPAGFFDYGGIDATIPHTFHAAHFPTNPSVRKRPSGMRMGLTMPSLTILMYHQVGPMVDPPNRSTYCNRRQFASQMRWLRRFRYHVLSMDQAVRALAGETPLPPRAVVLTFDDGYQDFYDHALPILEGLALPAIVYAVSGRLGAAPDWRAGSVEPFPKLLTPEQLRDVHRRGVTIGAHGVTHLRLTQVSPRDRRAEISESKAQLEAIIGGPVEHFCYPYGDYDAEVMAVVEEAGFRSAVTTVRGRARRFDDPFELPRKGVSFRDSLVDFVVNLHLKRRRKKPPVGGRSDRPSHAGTVAGGVVKG